MDFKKVVDLKNKIEQLEKLEKENSTMNEQILDLVIQIEKVLQNLKKLNVVLFAILPAALLTGTASAQVITHSSFTAAGSTSRSGEVLVTHALGQTVTGSREVSDYTLTQGFLQPDTSFFMSINEAIDDQFYGFKVFPNPARNQVHVHFDNPQNHAYEFSITNTTGVSQIERLKTRPNQTQLTLPVQDLPQGLYFLNVYYKSILVKSVRIIKI